MSYSSVNWLRTREMAAQLGIHRNTLGSMLRSGLHIDGVRHRKINPLAPWGEFLWNCDLVLMADGTL